MANNAKPQQKGLAAFDETTPFQDEIAKKIPPLVGFILILAFISMLQGLSMTSYTPAIHAMAEEFSVRLDHIQGLVGTYLIGVGIGQIFWGPIMDRYGRKLVVIVCSLLGVASNLALTLSPSFHWLAYVRLIQGFFLSGLSIVPSVIIRDVYSPKKFIIVNSWLFTLFLLTPAISPVFGGYIYVNFGWRMVFDVLSVCMLLSLLIFIFTIPETLNPSQKQSIHPKTIFKNYTTILSSFQSVILLTINVTFSITVFMFPSLLPAIIMEDYGVAPTHFGYYTAGISLLIILGLQINQFLIKRNYNPVKIWMVSSFLQVLSTLVNYGVVFSEQLFGVHLLSAALISATVSFNCLFNSLQIGNLIALYLMRYPTMTGTANALMNSLRMLIPGLIVGFMTHLDRHMGATLLIFNALLIFFNLCLTLLYRFLYGGQIEAKKRSERKADRLAAKEARLANKSL